MDHEQILARVQQVLVTECQLQPAAVVAAARLVEDLKLDSVDLLALVVNLENQHQVVLPDDWENPPRTVGDVAALVAAGLRHGH